MVIKNKKNEHKKEVFESAVDEEELNGKIDDLFDIASNKYDYIEARMEHEQLTFLMGLNIDYTLMSEVYTYVFAVVYTIYEAVMAQRTAIAKAAAKLEAELKASTAT